MQMTQAVLPSMKSRNTGTIINIGSIAGRVPYAGGAIYCASKAAVQAFTEAMRHELISTRIRVVNIDPGQVETEFSIVRFRGDEQAAKKVYEGVTPLTGQDIAEVIVFAASRKENVVIADVHPSGNAGNSRCWYFRTINLGRRKCIEIQRNSFTARANSCIDRGNVLIEFILQVYLCMCICGLFSNYQCCHSLASTRTHAGHAKLSSRPSQMRKNRRKQSSARRAQRI